MILVKIVMTALAYALFCFLSGFVFMFGKNGSGIKHDYFLTGVLLIVLIGVYGL